MNEDTSTRRRVARGPGSSGGFMSGDEHESEMHYDDKEKDVYSKLRHAKGRVSSGRVHKPPPPPPTSIVRTLLLSTPAAH
jgi:dolichyl-phosphate-mannose-protein mannosyltransferase